MLMPVSADPNGEGKPQIVYSSFGVTLLVAAAHLILLLFRGLFLILNTLAGSWNRRWNSYLTETRF